MHAVSEVHEILGHMTELAYMVREDWGQHGTAMVPQSEVIRNWVGDAPYLFAVTDVKKFNRDGRSADLEAAQFIAPDTATRKVFNLADLHQLADGDRVLGHAIIVLHPYERADLTALQEAVTAGRVRRVFVLIWSPREVIRTWLDAHGALNLHTQKTLPAPDMFMLAAAKMMIDEQYNGLSSGRGKDAVVQLVRAFTANGYPLDADAWLRAYFAAGGDFRHAESIEKLVKEMMAGVKHRVKRRYVDNILDIIKERARGTAAAS